MRRRNLPMYASELSERVLPERAVHARNQSRELWCRRRDVRGLRPKQRSLRADFRRGQLRHVLHRVELSGRLLHRARDRGGTSSQLRAQWTIVSDEWDLLQRDLHQYIV
jgi:hypothetical protein